jgi:hypothetical protein
MALSLYASARRIERLPRQRTYSPSELVEIVPIPKHLIPALTMIALVNPSHYEEI